MALVTGTPTRGGQDTFVLHPGDTDLRSGASTGDTLMNVVSGEDRLDFTSRPAGTATTFGAASTTAKDFASSRRWRRR